ncbi:hypothetical protein CK510_28065 [Brunnivagina elsteri CCALA 953]|uniref:Uncharacterized protein n=1 Tax=Brunnivagina elsteri CCALA 953 TaxID=987040 RepID=A0A2A2TB21_9CYAN|nr:hypothetical protein CK510_28065 [Calothrix elsteri CCALA 953]
MMYLQKNVYSTLLCSTPKQYFAVRKAVSKVVFMYLLLCYPIDMEFQTVETTDSVNTHQDIALLCPVSKSYIQKIF